MTAQLLQMLLLLGAATSFSLAILTLFLSLSKRLKKHQPLSKQATLQHDPTELPAQIQSQKSLLIAEETAREIVRNAEKEASEVLKRAKVFDKETIEDVDKTLTDIKLSQQETIEGISQDIVRSYREIFATLRDENINILKNTSKEVERDALKQLETFKLMLNKESAGLEQEVSEKIQASYTTTLKEIEAYKLKKIQGVDEQIQTMLEAILKDVLGKTIPLNEHHAIILKALEKAKKEGVFDHASAS